MKKTFSILLLFIGLSMTINAFASERTVKVKDDWRLSDIEKYWLKQRKNIMCHFR